jgi:ubiquitin-conjugating enzyme E2 J2
MLTPNGRFKENFRICLTMSDYHPELWQSAWYVSTILVGLHSFMMEDSTTVGSITTNDKTKIILASKSLKFNCQNKIFCKLFPELVELYKEQEKNLLVRDMEVDSMSVSPLVEDDLKSNESNTLHENSGSGSDNIGTENVRNAEELHATASKEQTNNQKVNKVSSCCTVS